MAAVRKRGNRWQVQVRRTGYPPLSRTFTTKADAEAWGRQREVELDRSEVVLVRKELKGIALSDLLIRYAEEVSARKRGADPEVLRIKAMLRDSVAATGLHVLTPKVISEYRDRRLTLVTSGSVRRELAIIQHCLQVAMAEWGVSLQVNPAVRVSKPDPAKSRRRRLRDGEIHALRTALNDKARNPLVRHVFNFALATGMRRGEVLSLTWDNIDWHHSTALLPLTKNGEARVVPLSPAALQVLQERREACLQTPQAGVEPVVFPISANAFRLAWERVKRRAGVEDLRFHDLRHEAISRFFEMGLSVPEVALISGHKDVRMLFRYTHLKAQAVAEKLASGER